LEGKPVEGATLGTMDARSALSMRAHLSTGSVGANAVERAHRAIDLAKKLQEARPRLHARPEVRFPLTVAHRQVGLARQADSLWSPMLQERPHDAWRLCAATEAWLGRPTPQPPRPLATCKRIGEKPKLDGQLDEEFWKTVRVLELTGDLPERLPVGAVQLAHDGEFLYVAIRCQKIAGADYAITEEVRTHDADVALYDRVELSFDVDRDYTTCDRLVVDYRGFTRDECLGDATWNPLWFVAAQQDASSWSVELAIAFSELAVRPPQPREAWALGLSRIMPGEGCTSWNKPTAARVRGESFGLLVLE
jgi:hypothetical protein